MGTAVTTGVALVLAALGALLFPPPQIRSLDQLLSQLSDDTTRELNDATTRFRMPILPVNAIGTLVDPNTRGGYVNNHGCLITVNTDLKPAANLFPTSYATSANVAAALPNFAGAAKFISALNLSGSDATKLEFSDIQVAMVGTDDIHDIARTPQCATTLAGRSLWIVRGYVQGKRTIRRERRWFETLSGAGKGAQQAGKAEAGGDVVITDLQPVPFMEIISQITIDQHGVTLSQPQPALAVSNPKPQQAAAAATTGLVYFQRDAADNSGHDLALIAALRSQGIASERIVQKLSSDRLPAVASVRYFNDSDKRGADTILQALRAIYPDAVQKRFRLAAPVGQMEVWLPADRPTP